MRVPREFVTAASAALAAIGVGIGMGAGTVSATPSVTPAPPASFQIDHTVFLGDPFPFATTKLAANTAAPGVARVVVSSMCNTLNRSLCLDWHRGGVVQWHNFANGRSGTATIVDDPNVREPNPGVDIATGPGFVTATFTGSYTMIPGLGAFTVN